jgi:hypothetical protein
MSATTTFAPFEAKTIADPRPIPEEAPVTIVTLFSRGRTIGSHHLLVVIMRFATAILLCC